MAKKANKSENPLFALEDLVIKMKPVFHDCYIYSCSHVIPGKDIPDSIVGDICLVLKTQYESAVELVFGKQECLYIPDITTFRDIFSEFTDRMKESIKIEDDISRKEAIVDLITEFENKALDKKLIAVMNFSAVERCKDYIEKFHDIFYADHVWKCMGNEKEMIEEVFINKKIFNLPLKRIVEKGDSEEYITIAKQLLPLVTENTVDNLFVCAYRENEEEELYKFLVNFHFSHFQLQAIYDIIPLPFL